MNILFKKGLYEKLPEEYSPGTIYVTTDTHELYIDVVGEEGLDRLKLIDTNAIIFSVEGKGPENFEEKSL